MVGMRRRGKQTCWARQTSHSPNGPAALIGARGLNLDMNVAPTLAQRGSLLEEDEEEEEEEEEEG